MRNEYIIDVFETIYKNFYWRLNGKNYQILATSEIYTRKQMCLKTANKLAKALKCKIKFKDLTANFKE